MKIVWTLEAQKDLKKIFKFYAKNVSKKLAQKTILHILNKVKTLELGLELGQEEEILKHLEQGHRYLIVKHNKIIYKVHDTTVYITHIFDTRQNPKKLK